MRARLPALVLALCAGLLGGPAQAEIRALIVTAGHYESAGIASLDSSSSVTAARLSPNETDASVPGWRRAGREAMLDRWPR